MPSRAWISHVGLLLIATFLLHDGYMATLGHVVTTTSQHEHSATKPGVHSFHQGHERTESMSGSAASADDRDERGNMIACDTLREGIQTTIRTLEQSGISLATLPTISSPVSVTDGMIIMLHQPPTRPPNVRRALFQVYRL